MEEWKYWIALKMVQGIGEVLFRNLLAKFPSPKSVFEAKLSELERVEGIGEKIAKEIKGFKDWNKADEEVRKIKKFGFKLLLLKDSNYPRNLFNTYNPPPFLYIKGDILPQDNTAVAIVGTRIPDRYARFVAERLAEELAGWGGNIFGGKGGGGRSISPITSLKK